MYSGQWLGVSVGDPEGTAMLDLDSTNGRSEGLAFIFSSDPNIPSAAAEISLDDSKDQASFEQGIIAFDSRIGRTLTPYDLSNFFPDANFPKKAEFEITRISEVKVVVKWKSDVGTYGEVNLRRVVPNERSIVKAEDSVHCWKDFRENILKLDFQDYIFRGQSKNWPIQTSFHRTSRNVLQKYLRDDIPALHRLITGQTKNIFDLDRPQQFGAFLNLIQHHGYPTPLLDWTLSPFVAAWFAFKDSFLLDSSEPVRIFCLNRSNLLNRYNNFQSLTFVPPHISLLEALNIENSRAVPQQAILTLTNLLDIESHIQNLEKNYSIPLLTAYDLPRQDADIALRELQLMGITRATMFPGIESTCLDLRDRRFRS